MFSANRMALCLAGCALLAGLPVFAHDPHDPIVAVALSPNFAQDQTIFAATDPLTIKLGVYALLRSTDGGISWTVATGLPNMSTAAIVFSPAYSQDQTLFVAGAGGLFASTNQGASWSSLNKQAMAGIALSPNFASDNTIFAATVANRVIESTNRGLTWQPLATPGGLTAPLSAIAVSPNYGVDNTLALGGSADGLFLSTDGGASWTQGASGTTAPSVSALVFSPGFAADQTIFAGSNGGGVLLSTDGGASWTSSNAGLTDLNITGMVVSPSYALDTTLWVTTALGGVFPSNNSGGAWTAPISVSRELSNLVCVHFNTIAATSTAAGNVLFIGMFEGLWSANAANPSFQYIDTIPTRLARYVNMSPNYANDQTVFVSTYGGGNLWSYDGGVTWTFRNAGMLLPYTDASGISPNFANDHTAFSGNHAGLQGTTDGGATWQMLPGGASYPRALGVSPNYAQDSTLLIGLGGDTGHCKMPAAGSSAHGHVVPDARNTGLVVSNDGGNTWTQTRLKNEVVMSIAMSPAFATDHTAFAASPHKGLNKSTNGGKTWTPVASLKVTNVAKVAVSPSFATDGIVIAGAGNGGVFRSTNRGRTWSAIAGASAYRIMDIGFSPNFLADHTVFLSAPQTGLMKSINSGRNFATVASYPDIFVTAIGISPNFANDQTILAASYHGVFKSTDGGATWSYTAEPARIEESRNTITGSSQPPTIVYQGAWSGITTPAASTSAAMASSEIQDTATLYFTGSGVRWLSQTGPNQGSADVQLDGVSQGTVSLNGPFDQYQQDVFELHGFPCGPHTLVITGLSQGGQTVSLDAFDVWTDTCPLVDARPAAHH